MIPERPEARATSAISLNSKSLRSGAILRKTGIGCGNQSRASITPFKRPISASAPCNSRSFSVLGLLTLTVAKSRCAPQCARTRAKSSARSALSLLAPRLRPITASFGRAANRAAAASIPALLNPKRLITARSSLSRNRRGRGLPGCGRGVTAPTSMNPNPARASGASASAFLSNPAANPTGLGRRSPARLVLSRALV